jgi:long-chain fatty acid transport protein
VSPELKLGFALTGNFGAPLEYDEDWVGRYYVQETTVLGLSFLPSIAYKVSDKLSLGASLNAMYGIYKNQVAINNVNPTRGRLAQVRRHHLGLGRQPRAALRPPSIRGSGSPGTRRSASTSTRRSIPGLAPGVNTALSNAGCSMPPSTWGSKSRSRRC